jgi:hypothetical protein
LAAQRQDRATQAKRFRRNLQSPAATQPAEATLEKILPETNLDGVPLTAVIDYLRDTTGANIFVNWHALAAAGVDQSTPIELSLHNVKFSKALSVILAIAGGQTKLGFEVDDNVITITTAEDIALKGRVVVIYNVADLVPDRLSPQERDKLLNAITTLIVDTIQPDSWTMKGGTIGTIGIGPGSPQLVVLQTADTQTHIRDLLDKLRQKQLPAAPAATPATAPTSALPASEPSPWKASLANGLTIEVLGITEAPSKDHPWWRPDGSPLAQRPYALSLPNQIPPRENEKARELVVRFSHLPEGDYAINWTLDPGVSSTGDGGPLIQGDHQIRELSAICLSAPIDKKTTNLTLGSAPALGIRSGPTPMWPARRAMPSPTASNCSR